MPISDTIVHADSNTQVDTDCMLTTYDNPYNPFTQFQLWFKYDMMLGYNCCGLLNETANVNLIQSEKLNEKDVNDAIDYIVKQNPLIYKKVFKSDFDKNNNNDTSVEDNS